MKLFHCRCGNQVFFDNTVCQQCSRDLGFAPELLDMLALDASADGRLTNSDGKAYHRCANFHRYSNCNWLLEGEASQDLCFSCGMNQVIPQLDRPGNLKLWTRIEQAKRRLLYSLLSLHLPLSGEHALRFRFLEDHRRNPDVYEQFVTTGHLNSVITINVAEADDASRHQVREQMHELYRTVLGHLRHESAHYYFKVLTEGPGLLDDCRNLFGDERSDYQAALSRYYEQGPQANWSASFISAYASSHPAEDFAETFAHFLHISDALESARAGGLLAKPIEDGTSEWIDTWIRLSVSLNEVNRSLGMDDAYPFFLSAPVKQKLMFIDRLVRQPGAQQAG